MHDLPTTLEGSVRAWLAVGEGAGGRGGSPDRCFSLVEGVSLAAPKPMSPCSMVQDSRFRMRSAHVTGGSCRAESSSAPEAAVFGVPGDFSPRPPLLVTGEGTPQDSRQQPGVMPSPWELRWPPLQQPISGEYREVALLGCFSLWAVSLPCLYVWGGVMGVWCREEARPQHYSRATLRLGVPQPRSLLLSVAKGEKGTLSPVAGPSPPRVPTAVLASTSSRGSPALWVPPGWVVVRRQGMMQEPPGSHHLTWVISRACT